MTEHEPSCTFDPHTDLLLNGGKVLARAGVLTCTCSPTFLDAQTAKRRAARKALDESS